MGSDLRPGLDPALEAFGVPATVTRPAPDDIPVSTTGFWLQEQEDTEPVGQQFQRVEPRRIFVLSRSTFPTLPNGTVIVAPEALGGENKMWRVDGKARAKEVDLWRALVALASE